MFLIMQDPDSNRIAQWLDKGIDGGILDLSHPMIPEAAQGSYTIIATTDKGEQISHSFEIKEYGLLLLHAKNQTAFINFQSSRFHVFLLLQSYQNMR